MARYYYVSDEEASGAAIGWLIGVMIVFAIIVIAVMIICSIGALIGAFYSLKNYTLSFKENVVDSNKLPEAA